MIHQFRNKKIISKRNKISRYILIFVFLFVFSLSGGFSWFGKLMNYVGLPIWKTEKIITENINNNSYVFFSKKFLLNENKNLKQENENLKESMLNYQILIDENNSLKELLGRMPEVNNFVLANILTKPNQSPYDTVITDAGENVGIKEGNQVYAYGSIPIGRINKVYEKTSLVVLYSSPGERTEGLIEGLNTSVELIGRGGGNFEMVVPFDLPSEKGIKILLPGSQMEILAYVEEIISIPTDPIKKVLLKTPINIQNLKWVEVKKN